MAKRHVAKKRARKKTPAQPFTVIVSSQSKLADLLSVKHRTIESWRASGMPGEPGVWDLKKIICWLRSAGPWRPRAMPAADDLLMDGGDSPALERYRLARARMVELELAKKEGSLVDLHDMREVHGLMAEINRRTCRRLEMEFGTLARDIYVRGVESCERAGVKYFDGIKMGRK